MPPPPGATCARCGIPLGQDRRSTAKFCTRRCKDRATIESGRQRTASLKSYYKRRYGLTPEAVAALRKRGCGICGRADGGGDRWKKLHVDHDHETGEVRGVLCHNCNNGLGHFFDSPTLLAAAAAYLLDYTP